MWAYCVSRVELRVSWTEHKTKQEVLKVANTTSSSLPAMINEKKMPVF